ncbi:bifunctional diaminohydroxyphosphoribosylaminopyrimidine deaminase/5-amino-6-(5-phosphoribosylamino)uracil reductase RibD [Chloroflexota bacterium]
MDYMKQALSLAKLALGQVSPNAAVGAIIVKDGEVVGQGHTQPPGSSHAEIMALNQAGEKARGSIMYVTLEPCNHQGKTPPCTKAIIESGLSEVHMAMIDPNPKVSGNGEAELVREGIKTYVGEHEEEAKEINEAFIKYIKTGIPFVTAKFAVSLDGKIATRSGDSEWISGNESRKYVHFLRYITDVIMTGANTVIVDNPRLTCRYGGVGGEVKKQPLRVIVDGKGRTPPTSRIFSETGNVLVTIGSTVEKEKKQALIDAGAELIEISNGDKPIDLEKLLITLGEREITSVLVEGGGGLLGSMFDQRLIDKVVAFIAPVIIGGEDAVTAVAGIGVDKMIDAIKLENVVVEKFGDDLMVSGYPGR